MGQVRKVEATRPEGTGARTGKRACARLAARAALFASLCGLVPGSVRATAQVLAAPIAAPQLSVEPNSRTATPATLPAHTLRARRFLAGRNLASPAASALGSSPSASGTPAAALDRARRQQLALQAQPRAISLSTPWQPVGPGQVASLAYGLVTGRVTSVAIDPTDSTGNTVYVGSTGGGVWRSTNAAGTASSVVFSPLTDTLSAFNQSSGSSAVASLSIGALSVGSIPGGTVVLAGTGDPNDATDSYYGTGILRSADSGQTWTLIQESHDGSDGNHSFFGLGFSGFAWSSTTPNLVVAALSDSAEGDLVNAPDAVNSVRGIYTSTDSGVTWQMATLVDGSQTVQSPQLNGANVGGNAVTSIVWNPVRQMFYAAVRFHGYYGSPDGLTWTRLAAQPGAGLTTSACPPNPNTTGSASCPIFRGTLAVEPVTGDTYAFTVDANNLDQGLWRDICAQASGACSTPAPTFASRLATTALETGGGSTAIPQGDYNLSLAAVASGTDTLVFAGTVDLFRCSIAAGCAFRNTTNTENGCSAPAQVAPAQHALAALATSGLPLLYLGNDGGLWRSTDGVNQQGSPCSTDDATHFENLNGALGSLAEVVSFAQHPTDPDTLLIGLGANGTAATAAATGGTPWPQLAAGEGGTVAIDPATPANWYISTGPGVSIQACPQGSACTASDFAVVTPTLGAAQVGGDASLLDPPWLLDPQLTSQLLVGTCRVWRGAAASGTAWSSANQLSPDLGTSLTAACTPTNAFVRSLSTGGPLSASTAVAPHAGSTVLYAGMAGTLDGGATVAGHVFTTASGSTATSATVWTDLAAGTPVTNDQTDGGIFNPGGFDISSVTADPHDASGNTLYATVMGFAGNGTNAPHLYRSTTGGTQWLNISANLPNAPANAVLVDPNDANTVYVAMDVGVYATSAVTSCGPSINCWSLFGTALPNAPIVALAAAGAMPADPVDIGTLRAATYGRGLWQIPLLTAAPAPRPIITLAPTALTFASQSQGTQSAPQTVTVTNTGNAPLQVSSVVTTGDFPVTSTCVGVSIAVNQSCTVQVVFAPTAQGARSGVLTVYGNATGGQATATLDGTGAAPAAILLTPLTLTFAQTAIGATSPAQNITLSNTGGTPAALSPPTLTGDFKISANTCTSTLAPDTGCTVAITFAPTASGARAGTFTLTDSSGTQSVSLLGTGQAVATDALTPVSLAFPAQQITTSSTAQLVTLTNLGDAALLEIATATTGDFTAVNGCGNSLAGHSSCTLAVTYVPKSVGPQTGALTVTDQFRAQAVALSGTGLAPPGVALTPLGGVAFAATPVGATSTAQAVTLSNNGGVPLSLTTLAVTGDFSLQPGSTGCGATLAVAATCTLQVVFTPSAAGPRTGALTVADNAANSPQVLALTGIGIGFTLTPDGATTVTVASGATAVFPLLLSSVAGVPGTATFTCTGAPSNATCVIAPLTAALGTTTPISVTVQTGLPTTSASRPPPIPGTDPGQTAWWALLLPVAFGAASARRRRAVRHLLTALTLAIALAALTPTEGCGSGRTIPPAASTTPTTPIVGPTAPTGTYTLAVSATSAGLTQSVTLTLIVQ